MRRQRLLTFLTCLLLFSLLSRSVLALSFYQPGPRGLVGLSRPVISQQFFLGEGERFEGVRMWLDGLEVSAVADETSGLVSYVPPEPLAPGRHLVRLEVGVTDPRASEGWYYEPRRSEFAFTVAQGALAVLPDPGRAALDTASWLSAYRRAAGLPAVVASPSLCASAEAHARYQASLGSLTHYEDPAREPFVGATVAERAAYFCYPGGVWEVIAHASSGPAAVDEWLGTLYHRIALIHPGNLDLGYGFAAGASLKVNVVDAGPAREVETVVAWPYPGQTGVPVGWDGFEQPDPLRLYPGTKGPLGYTVSLTWGSRPRALTLAAATLRAAGGTDGEVTVMTFSPEDDDRLLDTVAMIPRQPLRPGTRYLAHLAGTVDQGAGPLRFEKDWSFTTAGGVAALPFSDLAPSHAALGAIAELKGLGVVAGYPDGSFRPDWLVSRAELAKLLALAANWPLDPAAALPFSDSAAHWAARQGYLQAALAAGAINGFPDGTFRPEETVTRAQALKMIAASCGLAGQAAPPPPYADVAAGDWCAGWVGVAHDARLIGPLAKWPLWTGDRLSADLPLTRGEAAMLISNAVPALK